MTTKRQKEPKADSDIQESIKFPVILGWNTIDDVAAYVWCSPNRELLSGDLVIALNRGDLQLVMSRFNSGKYGVYSVTPGYTSWFPSGSPEFVKAVIIPDIEKFGINKSIIKSLIDNL